MGQVTVPTEAHDFVKEGLNKGLADYGISDSLTSAIDWIQEEYECCGVTTYMDYANSSVAQYWVEEANHVHDVPDSCCVVYSAGCGDGGITDNSNIYDKDCYTTGVDFVFERGMVIGLVGLAVILVELFVMLLAYKIREDTFAEHKKRKRSKKPKNPEPFAE